MNPLMFILVVLIRIKYMTSVYHYCIISYFYLFCVGLCETTYQNKNKNLFIMWYSEKTCSKKIITNYLQTWVANPIFSKETIKHLVQ